MAKEIIHSLLKRQLRKAGIVYPCRDPSLLKFIELVDDAYSDLDTDRRLLEHAIDVSSKEMSETNNRLRQSAEEAQRAAQFRSNVLANMSHEIRTPLNGIIGLSEILLDRIHDDASVEQVRLLHRSASGLLAIINDVLDLAKIEAGKCTIVPRVTDPRLLLGDLVSMFSAAACERALELATYVAEEVPSEILIDDGRVKQILSNLISNAVKFTPDQGAVIVYVHLQTLPSGTPGIRWSVADTGIGISREHLDLIFEAFSQVNSSISRKYDGTGLGLTITRHLVNIMSGELDVRSREAIGSLFQVTLPFERVEIKSNTSSSSQLNLPTLVGFPREVRILLAEDNLINQRVAVHCLRKLGLHPILAMNGRIALDLCGKEQFDIILMDCQMPEMSGFEACREIRALPGYTKVPIIALTALAMEGDRERCLANQMDDYIAKPFKRSDLEHKLRHWLKIRATST